MVVVIVSNNISAKSSTVMIPVILAFREIDYFKFEASLCYIVSPGLLELQSEAQRGGEGNCPRGCSVVEGLLGTQEALVHTK